ncbi:MAG: TonB-dependent receptor [Flavobacteriaceae bacterium]|nr:TonB-dependent receptor [Flavobacteriaceae bacterium]
MLLFCLSGGYAINTFDIRDSDYLDSNNITTIEVISEIDNINITDQDFYLKGTVVDSNGQPLPGASIVEKGTKNGTQSDFDGKFTLNLSSENAILIVSYLGFISKEIAVNKQITIDIVLQEDSAKLDEVVVIGYGSSRKKDLTGSVVTITSETIKDRPTSNLASAIQGTAAGVQVNQRQGTPGQAAQIIIRGANSLTGGVNGPLYVVDGFIRGDIGNNLDFNNVQSIQVLKDASSTAIYGSRGANGVIIITTKRGIAGKTEVGFSSYSGVQSLIKKLDFLNADEFKQFYLTAKNNATSDTNIDNSIIDSPYNTDWQDEVYRNALIQNYSIYVSGGTEKSKYYSSISYFDQEGILKSTAFDRLSFRFNADWQISDKFKISNNAQLFNNNNYGPSDIESISNGVAWARPTQAIFDENGNYTRIILPFPRTNPKGLVDALVNDRNAISVIDNIVFDYKIIKGLTAKVNVGAQLDFNNTGIYTPKTISESSFRGSATKSSSKYTSLLNENTLNYKTTINDNHKIDVLAGVTFQKEEVEGVTGTSIGFTIDDFEYNNLGAGEERTNSSFFSDNSLMSYLGRLNYSFKNKYLFTVSGRYDGSSRLSKNNRWHFFPSAALAWNISEEDFLKESNTINNLKLRASYGRTGSQAVSPYSTLSRFGTVDVYLDGDNPSLGYVPNAIGNTSLGWEYTDQYDFGVDVALFQGRINFTADYYNKLTSGLLFNRQVAPSSGYGSSVQNVGSVENKGFEFSLESQNFVGESFSWSSNFNISLNRSKVVDLGLTPGGDEILKLAGDPQYFYLIKGEVPYAPYGYVTDGLDPVTNTYIRKDLNGDGTIDNNDQTVLGNPLPNFIFGFSNKLEFKNFDLTMFFQGSVGNDVYVETMSHMTTLTGQNNTLQSVYDQIGTKYRLPNADNTYSGTTDLLITDGTYVRLKEITLGYSLPKTITKKIGLSNLRLYVTGTNLITIDNNYPWYDPETASSGSDVIVGWDRGGYPNNKSYLVGLQVKL